MNIHKQSKKKIKLLTKFPN